MRICKIDGCGRSFKAKDSVCGKHRYNKLKYGTWEKPIKIKILKIKPSPGSIVTTCKIHGEIFIENAKQIKNNGNDGFRCRICVNQQSKKSHFEKNKEKIREKERIKSKMPSFFERRKNRLLKKNFNITLNDYKKMLSDQNNLCKICNNIDPYRSLAVDHCHKTNKIRGLLCHKCNTSLGHFNDSIEILESAIKYLKENN